MLKPPANVIQSIYYQQASNVEIIFRIGLSCGIQFYYIHLDPVIPLIATSSTASICYHGLYILLIPFYKPKLNYSI